MATSGSTNFDLTRNQIIRAALRKVGAYDKGDSPEQADVNDAVETLNVLVKSWQNKGVRLWTIDWKVKEFSAADTVIVSNVQYTCILGHTSVTADNKPASGSQWQLYWRNDGTSVGADTWANSTAYTTPMNFELASDVISVDKVFYRDSSGNDQPMSVVSFDNYLNITDKDSLGTMSWVALERRLTPRLHIYQSVRDTDHILHYLAVTMLEDFDAASDNPDFPSRWIQPLIWGLADELAMEYGLGSGDQTIIATRAAQAFREAAGEDQNVIEEEYIRNSYIERRRP